jgi:hypothetical protein
MSSNSIDINDGVLQGLLINVTLFLLAMTLKLHHLLCENYDMDDIVQNEIVQFINSSGFTFVVVKIRTNKNISYLYL